MSVFSKSLFSLVSSDLMSFSFLTARHKLIILLFVNYILTFDFVYFCILFVTVHFVSSS